MIFINYRRADSSAATGRLDDHLREAFGDAAIYRDIDNIPIGLDFVEHIERAVAGCAVFLVIIGERWVNERLNDEHDFVRLEIEAALKYRLPIVPVLVDGAVIPKSTQIPATIAPILRRNGLHIDSGRDFSHHVSRLVEALRRILNEAERLRAEALAVADAERMRAAEAERARAADAEHARAAEAERARAADAERMRAAEAERVRTAEARRRHAAEGEARARAERERAEQLERRIADDEGLKTADGPELRTSYPGAEDPVSLPVSGLPPSMVGCLVMSAAGLLAVLAFLLLR